MPTMSSQDSLAVPPDQADSRQRAPGYRKLRRRLWLASCAAGAVGLIAGAIPALALARSGPVVFHACVTNTTGAIRIVSASTTCAAGQHKIFWNQTGPMGPPGPPGAVAGFEAQVTGNVLLNSSSETTVASLSGCV